MYLINATHFTKEYHIPNVGEINSGASSELEAYIDSEVRLFLQNVLGLELFTDLDANITNGILSNTAPDKWKNLVNGIAYEKDGKEYRWRGLTYTEGTFKNSLLTPYVYYFWLQNQISSMSGVGEVKVSAKNAVSVNSNQRLVKCWNDFVNQVNGGCGSSVRRYFHRGVMVTDWFGSERSSSYVDLATFLRDNQTDYPNAPFRFYEYKNQFGL